MRSGGIHKLAKYARRSAGMSTLFKLIRDSREYRRNKRDGKLNRERSLIHTYRINIAGKKQDLFMRSFAGDIDIFAEIFDHEIYKHPDFKNADLHTVIDLGANIGLASLFFLDSFPNARVVAVEPDPANLELLSRNLQPFLHHNQVKLIEGAVAAEPGTLSLLQHPQGYNSRIGTSGSVEVIAYSMQEIIQQSGFTSIDLLKIDIEGGEQQLFSGNLGFLHITRFIWMELHDGVDTGKIINILEANHFNIQQLPSDKGKPVLLFARKQTS